MRDGIKTAILVDGGFYRRRALHCLGEATPKERADELIMYCLRHLQERIGKEVYQHELYRIFYYDCPPAEGTVFNPITKRNLILEKTPTAEWTREFYDELKTKRKVALRMGTISLQPDNNYKLKGRIFRKLCKGTMTFDEITEKIK